MAEEYISREAAKKFIQSYRHSTDVAFHMEEHIGEIPAADVRPVVRGTWIEDGYYEEPCVCSNCGNPCMQIDDEKPRWNYCPNCGADMREADNVR